MSKVINYSFLRSATVGKSTFIDFDLNYGTITSVGQQVVYSGTAEADGIFVRPGLTYDLTGAAGSSDSIYFTGNYSDYTRTLMDGSTWEISRMVNGQTTESVKVLKLTGLTADRLVFADGAIFSHQVASTGTANLNSAVKSTDPSIGQGNYSGAEAKASTPYVAASNSVGVTFFTLRPGIKLAISGSAGIDNVYVADGSTVDATALGGSTDRIYLRGTWADYTKSVVNSNLVLTRTVGGATETVTVLPGSFINADKLIFADGSISTFNASKNLGVTNPVLNTAEKTPLLSDAQVLAKIVTYAQNNGGTEGQTPTLAELAQLGITGVGGTNGDGTSQPTLAMILSALADTEVTGAQADTKALIQGIVDAYAAIVQSADGTANNDVVNPTGDDYSKIGVSGVDTPQEVSLLGDVLDTASRNGVATNATAVDSVTKLQALGDAVQAVMDGQATREQLESLGVTGATDAKIAVMRSPTTPWTVFSTKTSTATPPTQ